MHFLFVSVIGLLSLSVQILSLPFTFAPPTTTPEIPPGLPEIENILGDPLNFSFKNQSSYLIKYQYMGENSPDPVIRELSKTKPRRAFKIAVKNFQAFAGLEPTGKMDTDTKIKMMWPRCGLPDNVPSTADHSRKKRFTVHFGGGWNRTNLTYKIMNTPTNEFALRFGNRSVAVPQAKPKEIKDAIRKAFKAWSKESKLRFTEVKRKPDIRLKFVPRRHGDGIPFDGENLAIAHAFFPIFGGNTHFDNSEVWGVDKKGRYGYDVFQVAVHELGHAFGLGHASKQNAVMYPFYEFKKNWKLNKDDINGINWLYPKKREVP